MNAADVTDVPGLSVRAQAFEAEFLGGPVWRATVDTASEASALGERFLSLTARARSAGVRLISCRLPAESTREIAEVGKAGFREIEQLVTLVRPVEPVPAFDADVGPARQEERVALVALGRTAFRHDRFHADPEIDDTAADSLKAQWVANALAGRAAAALCARDERGRPIGFNLLMVDGEDAMIDLIAVAEAAQGRGCGRALVAAGLSHFAGRCTRMRVGTQRCNEESLRLYTRMGFVEFSEAVTLHWTP